MHVFQMSFCKAFLQTLVLVGVILLIWRWEKLFRISPLVKLDLITKHQIENTCNKYGSAIKMKIEKINFMFEPKHKILYCPIAKVCCAEYSGIISV